MGYTVIEIVLVLSVVIVAKGCDIKQLETVYIYRTLPAEAKPLEVQCKFGNEALKPQTLYKNDQVFRFELCKGSATKTLSCILVWGNKKRAFDAFQDLPNKAPIAESNWSARVNGIHLADSAGNMKFLLWN